MLVATKCRQCTVRIAPPDRRCRASDRQGRCVVAMQPVNPDRMGHTGRELKQTQQEEEMSSLGWGSRRGGNKHSEHLPTQMLHRRTRMPNQATRGVMSSGMTEAWFGFIILKKNLVWLLRVLFPFFFHEPICILHMIGCLRGHTWRLQALNPGDSTAHSSLI